MHRGRRVLLVDDEPDLLTMLRRIVERRRPDATVVYASTVAAAESDLRSTDVRLVLTDMCMQADPRAGLRVVAAAQAAGAAVAVLTGFGGEVIDELRAQNICVLEKSRMSSTLIAELVDRAFDAR